MILAIHEKNGLKFQIFYKIPEIYTYLAKLVTFINLDFPSLQVSAIIHAQKGPETLGFCSVGHFA